MKKFSFYFFFLLSLPTIGQDNYRFGHVGIEEGLSHPDIGAIFEDSRGYLWIGTQDGLNKYNGSHIEIFKPTPDDPNSICHKRIKSIVEDRNGNMWFGTGQGLSMYFQKEDRFINFTKVGDCENCLAGKVVTTMLLDGDNIWLGTNGGLSVIDVNTHDIRTWWYEENTDVVERIFSIREISKSNDERLVMATFEGLVIYDLQRDKFKYYDEDDGLQTRGLGSVFKDSKGQYWLASDRDGLYHIEGGLDKPIFIHHPELIPDGKERTTVYQFAERENGELWIATHLGLTILNQKTGKSHFLHQFVDDNNSLSQNTVKELFIDSHQRVWVGTPAGLDVYDPYFNQFEFITHKKGKKNSIAGTSVMAIFEDSKGYIWYGTQDAGLSIMKKNGNGAEEYYHIRKGAGSRDLEGNEVYSIEEDKQGRIWVSTPQGLHIIDWADRSKFVYDIDVIKHGDLADERLPTLNIYQIYNDDRNKTWLATHGEGLISIDADNQFRQYKYVDQNPLYASADYVINVAEDADGSIWLGNFNLCGGIINDPESEDSYQRIKGDSALFGKNINDFLFIDSGVVMSTNMGVFHYESKTELLNTTNPEFTAYSEQTGLSSEFANVLIPQDDGLVWVSTNDGFSSIDLRTKEVESYKSMLSSGDRHFNHNAGIMAADSSIYFGSLTGALRFKPYSLLENKERPRVYFKNFKILNERVEIAPEPIKNIRSIPSETSYLDEIELNPEDKIFSLEIEVVNFRPGSNTEMQYMLEGFDDEWQSTENPLITRSNLSQGNYTLKARASNTSGIWSEEAVLSIVVNGPWWNQPWAYILYALLVIGLFQLLIYAKLQRERLVVKIKNDAREKFRIESSKDFHDEAGTKITRISLLTEILKKKVSSNEDTSTILDKIDENLKELNIGMRDFIWGLNVQNDNLLDTILRFTEFAHLFCEEANIQFKTQPINPELKNVKLEMSQRRHILLILKEGLNNSVRHGKSDEIVLNCTLYSEKFAIELKDNGTGFDLDSATNGNGLRNIRSRAKEIGADLSITSKGGEGSTILLELDIPSH